MEHKKLTLLSEVGEFGVIETIQKHVKTYSSKMVQGIGDDCSVYDIGEKYLISTTDLLVEGIHFRISYTPMKHLGYKAVMVNVSDIFAMNGTPEQILVGIAVSNKVSLEAIEEFYQGVNLACERFNVELAGGDTTSSQSGFTISITAIGSVKKEEITYRSGAKVNDLICVSGDLGASYVGLLFLEREYKIFLEHQDMKPNLEGKDSVVARQLKPEARGDIIERLRENKIVPTSMIDVSDGLSSELLHISKNSKVGTVIYEEKIPISRDTKRFSDELNINPHTCALNGGEDYELVFTIQQKDYEQVHKIEDISIIGHVTDFSSGNFFVTTDEKYFKLEAQGWQPFEGRGESQS